MNAIWIVYLEVLAFIDAAPNEGKFGFVNVVVSAPDSESAVGKVSAVLKEYGWEIIGIENVLVANPDREYQDDLPELIEDVMLNPNHILLSTLYSYKAN